mgnify:CR=1 FL=1
MHTACISNQHVRAMRLSNTETLCLLPVECLVYRELPTLVLLSLLGYFQVLSLSDTDEVELQHIGTQGFKLGHNQASIVSPIGVIVNKKNQ